MRDCKQESLVLLVNQRLRGLALWHTQRHLKHCAACQQALAELTTLSRRLQAVTTEVPSPALMQQIPTPRLVPHSTTVNRALRVLPTVGMAIGFLLALSLHTFGRVSTASQYLAYKLPTPIMSTVHTDTMRLLGPGAESLHNQRSKIGSSSMGSENYERVELIVKESDPRQAEQELETWVGRILESKTLHAQACIVWPLTPRKVTPSLAHQSLVPLLGRGILFGLLFGAALAGCLWLARTVGVSYLLPVLGALAGALVGGYWPSGSRLPQPSQTYGASATLDLTWKGTMPLGHNGQKLFSDTLVALHPQDEAFELSIHPSVGSSHSQYSEKSHRFQTTLEVSGYWTSEHATRTIRRWQETISTAFPQAEIVHGVPRPTADSLDTSPDKNVPLPVTLALYGLAIGGALVLLLRLGSMIPGGLIGCIVAGGIVGLVLIGVMKTQAPSYDGAGTIVLPGRSPNRSTLEWLARRHWPRELLNTTSNSMCAARGNEIIFKVQAKDPKAGERFLKRWIELVRDAPEFKLLNLKTVRSEKTVSISRREDWRDYGSIVIMGLAVGLFMGLARRR